MSPSDNTHDKPKDTPIGKKLQGKADALNDEAFKEALLSVEIKGLSKEEAWKKMSEAADDIFDPQE